MSASDVTGLDLADPELISRVREGDVDAFGTLFSRHVDAATRLARLLVGSPDADDLVSEAFVKVLNVLLGGGGPDVAFRAYLLTAVRRLHIDKVRAQQRLTPTGDLSDLDPGVPFTDTVVAGFEGGAAAKAFASLPERWQLVLWHLEVENQKPADIAPLLGMSANSVSALAYRAREGLRQAFLNMHSGDLVSESCQETHDLLGGYVRHALSRRDTGKVEDHLDRCRRCTGVYLELSEVNSSLAGLLGPALLGGIAAAYVGGGAAAGLGAGTGVLALVGRARDVAMGNLPVTAAATVAAVGVAGVTAIAVINRAPDREAGRVPAAARPPAALPLAPSTGPPSGPTAGPTGSSPSGRAPGQGPPSTTPSAAAGDPVPAAAGATETSPGTSLGSPSTGASAPGGGDTDDPPPAEPQTAQPTRPPGAGPAKPPTKPGKPPTKPPSTKPSTPPSTPPPSTTPTPKPTPKPSTPTRPKADVKVSATTDYDLLRHFHATARVTGVPDGLRVRLRATITEGDLHVHKGSACQRESGGKAYVCWVGDDTRLRFGTHTYARTTITFTVSPPEGYDDPQPGDNSTSATSTGRGDGG